MSHLDFQISGMTCDHCAKNAEEGLNALEGVTASVSYETGVAQVNTEGTVTT
ncbi:MAG TPA: heavy-metal-associated domain-containing protein, partial [Gammaproteobacteria bacterium]|nr:heavy-metal-associated domain-containing protein [Gammaproteobacteria bacterium]